MMEVLDRPKIASSRVPRIAKKPAPAFDFVPVIFANGEDCDVLGLVAAFQNDRVQFDDRIYEIDEEIVVSGRNLRMTRSIYVCGPDAPVRELDEGWVVARQRADTRHVTIQDCDIFVDHR